jgi:hypothetical protein
MSNLVLKYVMRDEGKKDIYHTSGYAKMHGGDNMGAVSAETFAQRRAVEAGRKYVQGYRNSRVIGGAMPVGMAKTYVPPKGNINKA